MKNYTDRFWAAKQQFGVLYALRYLNSSVFFPPLFFPRLQSLSRKLQGTHQSSEEALACPLSFSFLGVKTKNWKKNENKNSIPLNEVYSTQ